MLLRIFLISQLLIGLSLAKIDLFTEYSVVLSLKKYVEQFRKKKLIKTPFPRIGYVQKVSAKNIIQKSLEVLSKINLLRIKNGFGKIVVPTFPSRKINKNEVFKILKRLENEMELLTSGSVDSNLNKKKDPTYVDIYKELWSVSLGLDELLGRSGYTPSDVYGLSVQVVELAKFLRQSQNFMIDVEKPKTLEHKHPNHALYAAYDLIEHINKIQKNLWMEPIKVKEYPKRVIAPTEVYDTLGIIIAELQGIKYRLGLEKEIEIVPFQKAKTPNDVIANINYAIALLPSFGFTNELIQYDRANLVKTPADVYMVAGTILHDLKLLFKKRGIRYKSKKLTKIYGLRPTHVYQKTLENLEKINLLRDSTKIGKTAIISEPSKLISPTEVYELAIRLERELALILDYYNVINHEIHDDIADLDANIVPGDVYFRMQKIALMFDALMAEEYTPSDSYIQAYAISKKVEKILLHFNKTTKDNVRENDDLDRLIQPRDVLDSASKLLELIQIMKKRLNIKSAKLVIEKQKDISPADVYNGLRLIRSELNLLMINFGIDAFIKDIEKVDKKIPSDVNRLIINSYENLNRLMQ